MGVLREERRAVCKLCGVGRVSERNAGDDQRFLRPRCVRGVSFRRSTVAHALSVQRRDSSQRNVRSGGLVQEYGWPRTASSETRRGTLESVRYFTSNTPNAKPKSRGSLAGRNTRDTSTVTCISAFPTTAAGSANDNSNAFSPRRIAAGG